jgi:small conductance mechanosensitive channel
MEKDIVTVGKDFQYYLDLAQDKVVTYAPKVLLGLLILWIGFKLIKKIPPLLDVAFKKAGFSDTMRPFLISIIEVIFKIVLLLIVAGVVGIELSIFATIIAASVFAIGMALQGSLGNFASGLIVLSIKPYEVGDYIKVEDYFGKVEEIGIFNTIIVTPGRKTMIIPNGMVTGDVVTNFSKEGMIRLELEVTMPYDEDFPKVQQIIKDALAPLDKILTTPTTDIGIIAFDTHFVKIGVLPYVNPDDYWEVTYDSYRNIKRAFSEHGIKVAYSEGVEMGAIGK